MSDFKISMVSRNSLDWYNKLGKVIKNMGRFASLCLGFICWVISDSHVSALSCAPPIFDQMAIVESLGSGL